VGRCTLPNLLLLLLALLLLVLQVCAMKVAATVLTMVPLPLLVGRVRQHRHHC